MEVMQYNMFDVTDIKDGFISVAKDVGHTALGVAKVGCAVGELVCKFKAIGWNTLAEGCDAAYNILDRIDDKF